MSMEVSCWRKGRAQMTDTERLKVSESEELQGLETALDWRAESGDQSLDA
jgi:hypothetical protein